MLDISDRFLTDLPIFAGPEILTDVFSSEYLAPVKKSAVALRSPGFWPELLTPYLRREVI